MSALGTHAARPMLAHWLSVGGGIIVSTWPLATSVAARRSIFLHPMFPEGWASWTTPLAVLVTLIAMLAHSAGSLRRLRASRVLPVALAVFVITGMGLVLVYGAGVRTVTYQSELSQKAFMIGIGARLPECETNCVVTPCEKKCSGKGDEWCIAHKLYLDAAKIDACWGRTNVGITSLLLGACFLGALGSLQIALLTLIGKSALDPTTIPQGDGTTITDRARVATSPPIPRAPLMQSTLPFQWDHPDASLLRDLLADAYNDVTRAKQVAQEAGVNLGAWQRDGGTTSAWHSLIEIAAAQGKLRLLLERALKDPSVAGYHERLRSYIQPSKGGDDTQGGAA